MTSLTNSTDTNTTAFELNHVQTPEKDPDPTPQKTNRLIDPIALKKKLRLRNRRTKSGPANILTKSFEIPPYFYHGRDQEKPAFRHINEIFFVLLCNEIEMAGSKIIYPEIIHKVIQIYVTAQTDKVYAKIHRHPIRNAEETEVFHCEVTAEIYKKIKEEEVLYKYIGENFFKLKSFFWKILTDHKIKKSAYIQDLSNVIEKIAHNHESKNQNRLTTLLDILKNEKDTNICNIFYKTLHPDIHIADDTLSVIAGYATKLPSPEINEIVTNRLRYHRYPQIIQNRSINFCDITGMITSALEKIDYVQLIRCYCEGGKMLYNSIKINGNDFTMPEIEKDKKISDIAGKKRFFNLFLKELYAEGLKKGAKNNYIRYQIKELFSSYPCWGFEVLYSGSHMGWNLCDRMLRQIFPLLFDAPYKARLNQGMDLEINIEDIHTFSLNITRTYVFYPFLLNDNHMLDKDHPACSIQIFWELFRNEKNPITPWSMSITIQKLERLHASDENWNRILNALLYFERPNGCTILKDPALKLALKAIKKPHKFPPNPS